MITIFEMRVLYKDGTKRKEQVSIKTSNLEVARKQQYAENPEAKVIYFSYEQE
ncbi:MAG: hypothetical protein RR490_05655 [Niameybacter sp.]